MQQWMRHIGTVMGIAGAVVFGPTVAMAQFITSASALGANVNVITFNQFLAQSIDVTTLIVDPVRNVVLTNVGTESALLLGGTSRFGLGGQDQSQPILNDPQFCSNGEWTTARGGFLGVSSTSLSTVRFTFGGQALSGVGATMNYVPVCAGIGRASPQMRLLDVNMSTLATYDIDALGRIVTPNALNGGAFRGATRATGDIYGVEFFGDLFVLDDLTYSVTPSAGTPPSNTVPEPTTMWLLGAGLAGMLIRRHVRSATLQG